MIDSQTMQRAWDCQQVLAKLFFYLDERRYDELADLFDTDGIWHRQGKVLKGREAIMAAMEARSATYIIRHVMTNFLVTQASGEVAETACYITAYANDSGRKPEKPVRIQAPLSIFVASAKFRCSRVGVKLIELDLKKEFVFPNSA